MSKKKPQGDWKPPRVGDRIPRRKVPQYRDPEKALKEYYRFLWRTRVEPLAKAVKEYFTIERLEQLRAEFPIKGRHDSDAITLAISAVRKSAKAKKPKVSDVKAVTSIARELRNFSMADHKRVTGLDPEANPKQLRRMAEGFRKRNIDLITSIDVESFSQLEKDLRAALSKGTRVETLAKMLEDRYVNPVDTKGRPVNIAARSRLIARDQVLKHNGQLTKALQTDAGIDRYVWRASNDERVRDEHAALDGLVFQWSDPPRPGHPGEDYQCRCHAEPVIPGVDYS